MTGAEGRKRQDATAGTAVEVLEVVHAELDGARLRGFNLEKPTAGVDSKRTVYALEVEGWVLGRASAVASVELVAADGTNLLEVSPDVPRPDVASAYPDAQGAERSGFRAPLGTLALPPEFELLVRAVLDDGEHVDIARIRGRRAPLRSGFTPRIQPLMVTTLARTGSTLLVRLLESHPQVVAYRPFQYEPRVARYWFELFQTLSQPASYLRQITHAATPGDRHWWLGARPPLPEDLLDPELQEWMGRSGVEGLAELCQARIEAQYERIAALVGRPGAAYFAEKYLPNFVPSLMWEVYPEAREVMLIRDFRDMVCSMLAMNEKRGFPKFGRERVASDEELVEQLARTGVARMLESWKRRSNRAHLLRYEDLILRPEQTLAQLLDYLGLDSDEQTLETMKAGVSERTADTERHRTSADAHASIGRWRNDLSPELKRRCDAALGPALEAFGYRSEEADSLAATRR